MTKSDNKGILSYKANELTDMLMLSHDWIWEINQDFIVNDANGNLSEKLGLGKKEIIGKSIIELFSDEDKRIFKEVCKDSLKKGVAIGMGPVLRKNADQEEIYTHLVVLSSKTLKGEMVFRGLEKDISAYVKAKNDAVDATREKSLFLAKMSHEIRTPMNGIIGTAELLKDSKLSDEQKELLNIIDVSSNNLLSIINDILDISKLDAGKIELEQEAFNIYDVVEDVVTMLGVRVVDTETILQSDVENGLPEKLFGDELRLKQIIINFVNNAIKFTKKGSVTISIKKIAEENDKIKLNIGVIDTGIGISEQGISKLFKEFSQADRSMYRKFGGTGLGLMISKKLAELMGAEINVKSEVDKGSEFWIEIELNKDKPKEDNIILKSVNDMNTSTQKLKILVAEDNVINQKVAMINLRQLGHDVEIAVNGQMAVDMFKKGEYDVVLMDIQMPVLDGLEATLAIRNYEEDSDSERTKIVAITANAMKEDRDKCFEVGMDDYITKPFKADDLVRILAL